MTIEDYNKIYSYPVVKQMELTFSETGQQDIVLTNADICSEEMSLEESICSDEDLRFGACESSCFKVRVVNSGTFKGKSLVVEQNMVVDDERYLVDADGNRIVTDDGKYIIVVPGTKDATIQYGKYKVYSDEPSNDRMWRDLTCYDAMYEILNADVASWYSALTFPMTIKNLRDSFFTYLGITQETVTLVNDSFQTEGGFIAEGSLSGKTIIEAICELNGCFGHINRSGNFEYITIPSSESITYRWYVDGTGKYEDYVTSAITGIIARAESTDVGTSVGTTANVLIIENNPLVYGKEGTQALTTALTNLLGVVSQITYRPFNVDTYGNPMLPIGTSVTVNTKKYDPENGYTPFAVTSFVKSRTLNGIQGLTDSISATGKQQRDAEVNNIQSQILRTKGKVHDLKITVDELYSEIYDADTGLISLIQQLSDEIVLKVNGAGRMVLVDLGVDPDSSTSYFQVDADNISFFANDIMEMTANNIGINSTNFSVDSDGNMTCNSATLQGTLTCEGDTFTTIIDEDRLDIVNNLDDDVFVSIVAESWTPPSGEASYVSGAITISDGTNTSYLTSRELYIHANNSDLFNLLGGYHEVIPYPYCGTIKSLYNDDTERYSGHISLLGEEADILINDFSIKHFMDGEPFYCDYRGTGFITTNASKVWFTIPLPKSAYGKLVTCVDFVGRIRVDGKYIHGTHNSMTTIVATANVTSDNYSLQVALTKGVNSQQQLIPYGNKKKLNNRVVGIDVDGTFIFNDPIPEPEEEEE